MIAASGAPAPAFAEYEADPTDFVASMWLGQGFLGSAKFEKRTMREQLLEIPMQVVKAQGASEVIIGKSGSGRLYYRLGMKYALKELRLSIVPMGVGIGSAQAASDEAYRSGARSVIMVRPRETMSSAPTLIPALHFSRAAHSARGAPRHRAHRAASAAGQAFCS